MPETIQCPITEFPCSRSACLSHPEFPDCERSIHELATQFFASASTLPVEDASEALFSLKQRATENAQTFGIDLELYYNRLISLIESILSDNNE